MSERRSSRERPKRGAKQAATRVAGATRQRGRRVSKFVLGSTMSVIAVVLERRVAKSLRKKARERAGQKGESAPEESEPSLEIRTGAQAGPGRGRTRGDRRDRG